MSEGVSVYSAVMVSVTGVVSSSVFKLIVLEDVLGVTVSIRSVTVFLSTASSAGSLTVSVVFFSFVALKDE